MNERDEALGRLTEELAAALTAGEAIDDAAWAARCGVAAADVAACRRALRALHDTLGEEAACGHPELPRPALPGYTIEAELGRGGMGVVYRAQQDKLGRPVAIKVLRPGDLVFGDALARFRSEAKSLARLRHRHIVSVHDVGETKDGLVWFAMDLIEGETLAAEITRRGPLLPARAVRILRQVTSAIAHAHAQGVVHRDLKPHNVLIDRNGDAYVVDFGLARDAASLSVHTVAGQLLGTPQYMSPEQARGDVAAIGEASDVWALGALLYECLGGRGPFAGLPLHETIRSILDDEPRPLRQVDARVPAALAAVAGKALQKRPQDRYDSALAFGEELERFAQGEPVLAKPPSRAAALGRRVWRQRRALATAAVAVVAVVAWFVAFVLPGVRIEGVLTSAAKACDDGFPGAAVAPLRAQMQELAADDPQRERCIDALLRALVERAGELLVAGDATAAAAAAQEANDLRDAIPFRSFPATVGQRWYRFAAEHLPLAMKTPAWDNNLPSELLDPFRSSLRAGRAAERRIAQQLAMGLDGDWLEHEDDELVVGFVVAMHEIAAAALAGGGVMQLSVPRLLQPQWDDPGVMRLSRRGVVAALANSLAARRSDVAYHRLVLCTLFRAFGLPGGHWFEASRWSSDAALLAEARGWADTLATAAQAPPEQAMPAIRDRLVQAVVGDDGGSPPSDLREAAAAWVGAADGRVEPAELRRLAAAAREEPLRARLARTAGLTDGEDPLATQLLARAAAEPAPARRLAYQWLLRCQAPATADAPLAPALAGNLLAAWRRGWSAALGLVDTQHYAVQFAMLHFADGAAEPEIAATGARDVQIGQRYRIALRAMVAPRTIEATPRRLFDPPVDGLRELPITRQRPGEVGVVVEGTLHDDADGPKLDLEWGSSFRVIRANLPGRLVTANEGGTAPRLRVGQAAGDGVMTVVWADGTRASQFVVLRRLVPAGTALPQDLRVWRDAMVASWRTGADAVSSLQARDWRTPGLWPLPEVRDGLAAHFKRFTGVQGWALPLAGGATRPQWPESWPDGGATLVRLATAPSAAVHRDAALAELARRPDVLVPGVAATLVAAADESRVAVPSELLGTVRTIAARPAPIDWSGLTSLAFVVVTLACFAWRLLGRRRAGLAAVLALIGSCRLVFAEVELAGVLLTPLPLTLLGVLGGLLLAPLHRGWLWRGVVAFTVVMTLLAAWLPNDSVLRELVHLREFALDGWLLVLVVLVLARSLVHEQGRVRRPRRAPSTPRVRA